MKKAYLYPMIASGFALALYVVFFSTPHEMVPSDTNVSLASEHLEEVKEETNTTTLVSKDEKVQSIKTKVIAEKKYFVKEKIIADEAFEVVEISEMKKKRPNNKPVEPVGAYNLEQGTIKSLFVGDTLLLTDIDGFDYSLKVAKRTVSKSGAVILEASIEGEEESMKSILTEGKKTSFITLNTPNGVYEFETINGNGYVYSSSAMKNAMIDYSKTDALIPPKRD